MSLKMSEHEQDAIIAEFAAREAMEATLNACADCGGRPEIWDWDGKEGLVECGCGLQADSIEDWQQSKFSNDQFAIEESIEEVD